MSVDVTDIHPKKNDKDEEENEEGEDVERLVV